MTQQLEQLRERAGRAITWLTEREAGRGHACHDWHPFWLWYQPPPKGAGLRPSDARASAHHDPGLADDYEAWWKAMRLYEGIDRALELAESRA